MKKITSLIMILVFVLTMATGVFASQESTSLEGEFVIIEEIPISDEEWEAYHSGQIPGHNAIEVNPRAKDTSKPTKVWDISKDGQYDFSGKSNYEVMYSSYKFKGKTKYSIKVTNYYDALLYVTLEGSSASTQVANGTSVTLEASGLTSTKEYYIKFNGKLLNGTDFSGHIK